MSYNVTLLIKKKPVIQPPPPTNRYVGWRMAWKQEKRGYQDNPWDRPAVLPPTNAVAGNITRALQELSYELMWQFNSTVVTQYNPKQLWTRVHDHDRAFTNHNGFGNPEDPRRNYILMEDLTYAFPKYDKLMRMCSGNFMRGELVGDEIVCTAGIHAIDYNTTLPTVQTILDNQWFLLATTLNGPGEPNGHFPQGKGGPVVLPFIIKDQVSFPAKYFYPWDSNELPDVLKVYDPA